MSDSGAPESLIACEGGLDNRAAPISAAKGTLAACYNFEKDQGPGYVKRLGHCRYDGRIQGPENDAALVIFFNIGALAGTFQYGEQVRIVAAGFASIQAIVIGFNNLSVGGLTPFLVVSYPVTDFPHQVDLTGFPPTTGVTGLVSGATLSAITSAKLMNDSSLTVLQYDYVKSFVQYAHAGAVKAVPGRNESPVDAIFTYGNNTYAIHDCVIFNFANGGGSGLTTTPLEGHCLRHFATGNFMGRILAITNTNGDWTSGGLTGSFVVYDYPLGQAFPAAADRIDLYDATNTTLLFAQVVRFGTAIASAVNAAQTRALLYSTYEQYVKDIPMTITSPIQSQFAPPTWSRVRIGRELAYSQAQSGSANGIGFGAVGANQYSIYEYSRQSLTAAAQALVPINTGEKPPVTATESNPTPHWVNINNIKVQDAVTATYNTLVNNGNVTDFLQATAFDLSGIPADSIILGIQVRCRWQGTVTAAAYVDETVSLMGNNFANGRGTTNKASRIPSALALTDYNYGSASDTWGEQLTVAQLQDPSFGVAIRFQRIANPVGGVVGVDFVGMTISYAPPTRTVYIRDPGAVTVTDVLANVIDYQIDSGDFVTATAVGVLTVSIGATEAAGTPAGKARRIGKGNEIRDAASTGANVPHGSLLAYTTGEDSPITFPASAALDNAGSRYEVMDANFWDTPDARAAFIANGVEYCTQFDGTFFVRIHTGRAPMLDCPRHVAAHGSPTPYLYLGFASGGISTTGGGHPTHYLGSPDPQTFVFGEPITGMLSINGQTLGVWTDRATRGLQGNNPATATPFMISPAINCIEYTLVNLVGEAVWTSYRGVETLRTVNSYGDFETLPLSAAAQLWLQPRIQVDSRIGSRVSRPVYAIGVRNKRQYRLFFQDGYFFTLTMFDAGDIPVCMTGRMIRPNVPLPEGNVTYPYNNEPYNSGVIRHIYNGTRSDGKELIFCSFENQNVFVPAADGTNIGPYFPYGVRLDCGFNDDVLPAMPCYIEFNSIYAGNPVQGQQFNSGTIFTQAYGGTIYNIYTKTDFDGPIYDQANNAPLVGSPPTSDIYVQTITLPLIETRAFIPVPNRMLTFNIAGYGEAINSLRLRIDGTQTYGLSAVSVPLRITHLNIETLPGAVKTA